MTTRQRSKPTSDESEDVVDEPVEDTALDQQEDGTGLRADVSEEESEAERDQRIADLVPPHRQHRRASLPLTHEAMLVRGLSFRLSYTGGTVVFWAGQRTPINAEELAHLSCSAFDTVTVADVEDEEGGLTKRLTHKFLYYDRATGEEVQIDVPDYVPGGRQEGDQFDRASAARAALRKRKRRRA